MGSSSHGASNAENLPAWITVDELAGSCPVQGWGRAGAWRWYFRARWDGWCIAATTDPAVDPIDVLACSTQPFRSETAFFHQESYGDGPYDAGYMDLEEARHFIVRELSQLRAERPG
jgi:hypothetical protein